MWLIRIDDDRANIMRAKCMLCDICELRMWNLVLFGWLGDGRGPLSRRLPIDPDPAVAVRSRSNIVSSTFVKREFANTTCFIACVLFVLVVWWVWWTPVELDWWMRSFMLVRQMRVKMHSFGSRTLGEWAGSGVVRYMCVFAMCDIRIHMCVCLCVRPMQIRDGDGVG